MHAILATVLLCAVPQVGPIEDEVDLVELNHFYDERAKLVFSQVIYWDWNDSYCRFQVRAWRLYKTPQQVPTKQGEFYTALFYDGKVLRQCRSRSFVETWLQYDPEQKNRGFLPTNERKNLTPPKIPEGSPYEDVIPAPPAPILQP